jgi:hypothetical protein
VLFVALIAFAMTLEGCSSTCTGDCQHQYDKCMDKAPPGAARADCQAEYDRCVSQCQASR